MSKKFDYYDDWNNAVLTCHVCGWSGRFPDAAIAYFKELQHAECPKCDCLVAPILAIVSYPTHQETKDAANTGNTEALKDMESVLRQEKWDERFHQSRLKQPDELPELEGNNFEFTWDFAEEGEERFNFVRLGDHVVWKQLAAWECVEEFNRVKNILKDKYKKRFLRLTPTEGSETWLYGDDLSSPKHIEFT